MPKGFCQIQKICLNEKNEIKFKYTLHLKKINKKINEKINEKTLKIKKNIYIIYIGLLYFRICKVLETRSKQDEERMDHLTAQLKEARIIAEDADTKSDEISRKLTFVEDELEIAEDRVKSSEA